MITSGSVWLLSTIRRAFDPSKDGQSSEQWVMLGLRADIISWFETYIKTLPRNWNRPRYYDRQNPYKYQGPPRKHNILIDVYPRIGTYTLEYRRWSPKLFKIHRLLFFLVSIRLNFFHSHLPESLGANAYLYNWKFICFNLC